MEKRIVFFELPVSIVDRIDAESQGESRSLFVSELLERQLETRMRPLQSGSELSSSMADRRPASGELSLVDSRGVSLGQFNINSEEGFAMLTMKICELSNDPIVRMKARNCLR